VKFARFRELEKRRVDSSNRIWAIIVGSKMAASTLQLTKGSSRTLAEIFPSLQHVGRFDMRSDKAAALLGDAELEMCTMGMAHAIALHEDFVKTCLEMLIPSGKFSKTKLANTRTVNAHEYFAEASGHTFDVDALALFHVTRLTRNCHIHAGGLVDTTLVKAFSNMTPSQQSLWSSLTGESIAAPSVGSRALVGVGGLVATLAVGKRLAYDVNLGLQTAISRESWADIAADEYFSVGSKHPKDPSSLRALRGYLKGGFAPLALTDAELQSAIDRRK
jgi:hypothetical protein